MDSYEATKIVFSRIQSLDPENASKAMGYILWQDLGEKEMIRLAFGPETLLISFITQAKSHLGLPSGAFPPTPSTPTSPSPFNPLANPTRPTSHLHQSSPRIVIPNNGFHVNPSSPSSPWSISGFSDHRSPNSHISPRPGSSLSYAAVVNGSGSNGVSGSFSPPAATSFPPPFYNNGSGGGDPSGDYNAAHVQEQLSFIDDSSSGNVDFADPIMSPSGRSDSVAFPFGNSGENHHHHAHRRSCSVSDAFLGGGGGGVSDDGGAGIGWRPCMYFARGFCKNGSTCKFIHGGGPFADSPDDSDVGSPGKMDGFEEFLRMKAIQQQRFAATSQLMAGGPFPYNKCMSFMNDSPRSAAAAAAALMMGDDIYKFGRFRGERSDFLAIANANSSSRQIYLTFPADSTFKEEDVSAYFSKFGPVQDVRIPYQQKRMFGFVTFIYPETVKMILAKGNPHFVCDSRVLVKPYKEKGKVPDKKQYQHSLERGEFPSGIDPREPYDLPIGPRMLCDPQELLLRRKLEEQAELQQVIELQSRRLRSLQLMDLRNHHHHLHSRAFHPNFPHGLPSPSSIPNHHAFQFEDAAIEDNNSEGNNGRSPLTADQQKQMGSGEVVENYIDDGENDNLLPESLEHNLPENLFASPTKAAGENSVFSVGSRETSNVSIMPATSPLNNMSSINSCYFQMPSH
ncbi:zinc finger CCCH domain-containing protein 22-like isoform X2 [Impatiens glandulifera]|uniref:zinc finger CCCH domain-containing protein 22-like isoform X2 n=1 Tax=Impatiens glandulifera TaxID=253017 RepID=UPI001FB1867F|nr:zinc finger CCCH domain-containing protein 22-like isoform X2 [Impatiens glandulifera]